jgi:hypothetical protein
MTSTNVTKFIELQTAINAQITQYGEADVQLVGELDLLGDQLTGDEVNQLYVHYEGDDAEYEDVEDQVGW